MDQQIETLKSIVYKPTTPLKQEINFSKQGIYQIYNFRTQDIEHASIPTKITYNHKCKQLRIANLESYEKIFLTGDIGVRFNWLV